MRLREPCCSPRIIYFSYGNAVFCTGNFPHTGQLGDRQRQVLSGEFKQQVHPLYTCAVWLIISVGSESFCALLLGINLPESADLFSFDVPDLRTFFRVVSKFRLAKTGDVHVRLAIDPGVFPLKLPGGFLVDDFVNSFVLG